MRIRSTRINAINMTSEQITIKIQALRNRAERMGYEPATAWYIGKNQYEVSAIEILHGDGTCDAHISLTIGKR